MADIPYRTSAELTHCLRTGEAAVRTTFGMPVLDYLLGSRGAGGPGYFGRCPASVLPAIAKRHRPFTAPVFDLPAAEQSALSTFAEQQVSDRFDFLAGNLLRPGSRRPISICSVLHDWDDDRCIKILRNCRDRASGSWTAAGY